MYKMEKCPSGKDTSTVICSSQCSQTYQSTNGTVSLHNDLIWSATRLNCAVRIMQEEGSYLNLREMNMTVPCQTGFVEIRDGSFEDSPLMARLCGDNNNLPDDFQSSQNHVTIRLGNVELLIKFQLG